MADSAAIEWIISDAPVAYPQALAAMDDRVAAIRAEVDERTRGWWEAGVRHIVALRGDPAEGVGQTYTPHPGGYESSVDLVRGIKQIGPFDVSVAAYPEKHPESPTVDADLDMLAAKADAGADFATIDFFKQLEAEGVIEPRQRCRVEAVVAEPIG